MIFKSKCENKKQYLLYMLFILLLGLIMFITITSIAYCIHYMTMQKFLSILSIIGFTEVVFLIICISLFDGKNTSKEGKKNA